MKAHLHRRLFAAFAGAIALSMTVAGTVVGVMHRGDLSWRDSSARVGAFTARRFAEVWRDPPRRDALAQEVARDLNVHVTLLGTGADATYTPAGQGLVNLCRRPVFRAAVRDGGEVAVCTPPPRRGARDF